MHEELEALNKNNTWILVPNSANINIVGSKWVHRIKYKKNGMIEKYKAWLVSKVYINWRPWLWWNL